jgi:hypothetical protein
MMKIADQWFDDGVKPGGVVAFFESEMNFTAQVPEEISDRLGRGLDHRASYEFPCASRTAMAMLTLWTSNPT